MIPGRVSSAARRTARADDRRDLRRTRGFYRPAWAWLAFLLVLAVTLTAAAWQYHRGVTKAERLAEFAAVSRRPAQPLAAGFAPAVAGKPLWVSARGLYTGEKSLLLDNQTYHQTPGYHVLTPLTLADGTLVMVDRGWVPQNPDRRQLPVVDAPADRVTVQGWWDPLPEAPFHLHTDNCHDRGFPHVVEWPTLGDIACLYRQPPLEGRVLLAPNAPHGFTRDWTMAPAVPPSRHYMYAMQWLGFAAAAVLVFLRVGPGTPRRPMHPRPGAALVAGEPLATPIDAPLSDPAAGRPRA